MHRTAAQAVALISQAITFRSDDNMLKPLPVLEACKVIAKADLGSESAYICLYGPETAYGGQTVS